MPHRNAPACRGKHREETQVICHDCDSIPVIDFLSERRSRLQIPPPSILPDSEGFLKYILLWAGDVGWGVMNTYRILEKRLVRKPLLGCQRRKKCPILKFKLLNLDMDIHIGLN